MEVQAEMETRAVIEVRGLTKRFKDVLAVDNLDLTVRRSEIVGLLGPNGAGKTTTLQLLLGLTSPTEGTINILGLDMARRRRRVLSRVNFSSAYTNLPANLTVRENLIVFCGLYGVRKTKDKIEELADLLDIEDILKKKTGALSSGQATRLNLAKAMVNDPEILFLDEPTASLDPDIGQKVRDIIQGVQRERRVSVVYTSHNMREVEVLCQRIVFMNRGRAVVRGTPAEVIAWAKRDNLDQVFIDLARGGELNPIPAEGEGQV